jgi:hypothetical protein
MSIVSKKWSLLVSFAVALASLIAFRVFLNWDALGLSMKVADFTAFLAPLAFAAAVIERAVEILISPWRDSDASKLESIVAAVKARPPDPAANAQNAADLKTASDALDEYKGDTQRYAFMVSLTLSLLVSIAGVRTLGPFIDPAKLKDPSFTHGAQYLFFLSVDVMLSAALLSGGADGIHSVVNAITSFFDATADKSKT